MAVQTLPPGPKGNLILGSMADFRRNPLNAIQAAVADYGSVVFVRVGPRRLYILTDPNDIHDVLVRQARSFYKTRTSKRTLGQLLGNGLLISDGEHWKRQRKLAQPAFHHHRIVSYADAITEYTTRLTREWHPGALRDIHEDMMKTTMGIVGKVLFDVDVIGEAARVGRALDVLLAYAIRGLGNPLLAMLPRWFPQPGKRQLEQAVAELDGIIMGIIRERRASGKDTGDLLSMLLLSLDEDGSTMADKDVRDEAMTLFLAGHETTANALSWTWYLLSQHPEIEARLHEEAQRVLNGRTPTYADLAQLTYTEMVLKEAMRLYPPAWIFSRQAVEDVTVAGYPIRKGGAAVFCTYVIHRNPTIFPDPERFDPERFSAENEARLPKYAYVPFGGGPRVCIGNSFAMMEGVLMLAQIAQQFRLRLVPGQVVEPEPLITLRPRHGLKMQVEQR